MFFVFVDSWVCLGLGGGGAPLLMMVLSRNCHSEVSVSFFVILNWSQEARLCLLCCTILRLSIALGFSPSETELCSPHPWGRISM